MLLFSNGGGDYCARKGFCVDAGQFCRCGNRKPVHKRKRNSRHEQVCDQADGDKPFIGDQLSEMAPAEEDADQDHGERNCHVAHGAEKSHDRIWKANAAEQNDAAGKGCEHRHCTHGAEHRFGTDSRFLSVIQLDDQTAVHVEV